VEMNSIAGSKEHRTIAIASLVQVFWK